MPRQNRVPWDSVRGASSYQILWLLDLFKHVGVPPNINIAEKSAARQKMVEKHWFNSSKVKKTMLKVGVADFIVLNVNFRHGQVGYAELNDVDLSRYKFT